MNITRRGLFAGLVAGYAAVKAKAAATAPAPLILLLHKLRREKKTSQIEWFEEEYVSRWYEVKAKTADGYILRGAAPLQKGDVFVVPAPVSSAEAPMLIRAISICGPATALENLQDGTEPVLPIPTALRYVGNSL